MERPPSEPSESLPDLSPPRRAANGLGGGEPSPEVESCDWCGSTDLWWRNCKLLCRSCSAIVKSCADL